MVCMHLYANVAHANRMDTNCPLRRISTLLCCMTMWTRGHWYFWAFGLLPRTSTGDYIVVTIKTGSRNWQEESLQPESIQNKSRTLFFWTIETCHMGYPHMCWPTMCHRLWASDIRTFAFVSGWRSSQKQPPTCWQMSRLNVIVPP